MTANGMSREGWLHQTVPMGMLSPAQDGPSMFSETPAPNRVTARETDSVFAVPFAKLPIR